MGAKVTSRDIEEAVRALIRAEATELGFEVALPVIYPTGEHAAVVVERGEVFSMVHDSGNGAMCLVSEGIALSAQLRRRLSDLAAHYSCVFRDGRVSREVPNANLAVGIAVVANASRAVADVALDVRRQVEHEFSETVTSALREIVGKRLRTRQAVKGKSGREYRVENIVLDPAERHRVAFIETIRTRSVVADKFMEFHDLSQMHDAGRYSVTNGSESLTGPDEAILAEVSQLVPFAESRSWFRRISGDMAEAR